MNARNGRVTGIPGVPNGRVSATVADAWFDADTTAHLVALAQRVERAHAKAAKRLSDACRALDAALAGHALEDQLRTRLLIPLQGECERLAENVERAQVRLSLCAPATSQAAFERGIALQLQDLEDAGGHEGAHAGGGSLPQGSYLLSEDGFNRLERARDAAMLLASVGDGNGERMAITYDALAASAAYVFDDLAAAVANAQHASELDANHGRR
ncbi:hypothetical protein [Stenotrophomonas sp.]|jgi:hypothetical protein|uniref:hypothetical protein n=1 Tax=Stenotrophomonas sp. TaxID=69392 RepID=UPI0028A2805F|nr:hypothetical protein [Stenotrophomonas sp.]